MSTTRFLFGVVLGGVTFGVVYAGARAARVRLLPGWSGPPAWLVDAVLGLTVLVLTSELLGWIGWFRLAPTVLALTTVGAAAWYAARRLPTRFHPEPVDVLQPPPQLGPAASYAAVAASAVVAADWATRTVGALRSGPVVIDTLWYHLPIAARFVQTGSVTSAHYTDGDAFAASFPANGALQHALGIMFLGSDVLTPLLNLAFLALAMLGAWTLGRAFGVAPAALVALDAVLAVPVLVATQPGGGYSDIVGIALLLAAGAMLVSAAPAAGPSLAVVFVAGLAAGLAIGTKYQFAAPVAAFAVVVCLLSERGRRLRHSLVWLAGALLTGAFWYGRNFVRFDNPLPAVRVEIGPIVLPEIPSLFSKEASLLSFLDDGDAWREDLFPGLATGLGPVWWGVSALALAGTALALGVGAGRARRMLALVAVGSLVGFVTSPSIHDVDGRAALFGSDLRYLAFFLALGGVLLPTVLGRRAWWAIGASGVVVIATQLDPSIWPSDWRADRLVEPLRGAEPVVGIGVGVAVLLAGSMLVRARPNTSARRLAVPAGVVLAVVTTVMVVVHDAYLDRRYRATQPIPVLYDWAQDVSDERIGVAGDLLYLQYPFYGKDLSNHVQYVGRTARHGAYFPIARCGDWRRALNAGRYSYVVTASDPQPSPDAAAREPGSYATWTEIDGPATLIRREITNLDDAGKPRFGYVAYSLFRVDGRFDPDTCPE